MVLLQLESINGDHRTSDERSWLELCMRKQGMEPAISKTSGCVCPYLRCFWDRSMRTLEPDTDNRCFALPGPNWIARLLGTGRRLRCLDFTIQRELCFVGFRGCGRYQRRSDDTR